MKVAEVEACLAASLQAPMASHGFRFLKGRCMFVRKDALASPRFVLSVTKGGPRYDCHVGSYLQVRLEEVEALIAWHMPDGFGVRDRHGATLVKRFSDPIPREVRESIRFKVTSPSDCDRLGPALYDLFVAYGIPYFEAHRSYDQIEKIILAGPPGAVPINSPWRASAVLLAIYALQGRRADFDEHAKVTIGLMHDLENKDQVKSLPGFLPIDPFERFIRDMRAELTGSPRGAE